MIITDLEVDLGAKDVRFGTESYFYVPSHP